MRKRPLHERVEAYLQYGNPFAARILIHRSDLCQPLFYVSCISPITGKVLPLVILGTNTPASVFRFRQAPQFKRHDYMTNSTEGWDEL